MALTGGKVRAHSKTKKLVFAEGVYAEVIKDKSSGAKKFVKEIPEGVAQVLHAGRATDVYIDMRDEIVQKCEVQVEVLKELFDKVDHWDARKINDIVDKYKPEFKKHGVQVREEGRRGGGNACYHHTDKQCVLARYTSINTVCGWVTTINLPNASVIIPSIFDGSPSRTRRSIPSCAHRSHPSARTCLFDLLLAATSFIPVLAWHP